MQVILVQVLMDGLLSIGGEDNSLRYTVTTAIGDARAFLKSNTKTIGKQYKATFSYYIPSTNPNLNAVFSDENNIRHSVLDTWTTVTESFTASSVDVKIYVGDSNTYLNPATTGETAYIKNVSVKEVITSNVPRIDYSNGCGSLLLEPQRTNLVTQSEDFSNASWIKTGLTVNSNQIISPDGTLNADEVNITTANAHYLFDSISVSALTNYTFTFYVKKGTATDVSYSILNEVNFTNIVNTTSYFNQISDTDWTRISVEFTTPSGCTSMRVYPLRDGSSIGTVYIYGAQVEQGSYPTSYIKTSGTTVTRIADTSSTTGLSSVINSTEGVFYAEIAALSNDGTTRAVSLSDGTTSNVIRVYYSTTDNRLVGNVKSSGVTVFSLNNVLSNEEDFLKVAIFYKLNDFKMYINGIEVGADASGAVPLGLSRLAFDNGGSGDKFYGKCQSLIVFPTALTDEQLTDLTGTVQTSFNSLALSLGYTIL